MPSNPSGYKSCLCHGWLYKEDGSEDALIAVEHRGEPSLRDVADSPSEGNQDGLD